MLRARLASRLCLMSFRASVSRYFENGSSYAVLFFPFTSERGKMYGDERDCSINEETKVSNRARYARRFYTAREIVKRLNIFAPSSLDELNELQTSKTTDSFPLFFTRSELMRVTRYLSIEVFVLREICNV